MAAEKSSALTQLHELTECCICFKTLTDPRMLPCVHTFCLQCLKDLTDKSNKKPEDILPCPVCRNEFNIPKVGVQGIQKNFFMAGVIEVRNALTRSKFVALPCEICKVNNQSVMGKIPVASNRCLVCQENLCESCCKMHKSFKMSKNHEILKIGGDAGDEDVVKNIQMMNCDIHRGKPLNYYCSECKKVVCVSCFGESHKTHDYKVVKTVEEFRKIVKTSADLMLVLTGDLLQKKQELESKEDFLKKMVETEEEILQRSRGLKEMIDTHNKSLMCSLFDLKNRHLKEIQTDVEEVDRRVALMESFSSYCDELRLKGSDSEVCRIMGELLRRTNELEEDHKMYVRNGRVPYDVTFQATQWDNFLRTANGNVVGSVNETVEDLKGVVVAIGRNDDDWWRSDSYKVNLRGHSDLVSHMDVPTTVNSIAAASAAVYKNTMFITGIGEAHNEIWKYNFTSGWMKCGSLVQGREDHCAEFIGNTLYICGGCDRHLVLDSIEAYNATTRQTAAVGQLRIGFRRAASVVYRDSLYVFGGLGKSGTVSNLVQVVRPSGNSVCSSILSTSVPRSCVSMRAVLWDACAILVGRDSCLIFDFEDKTWLERPQFKADVTFFGMVLETESIFIIGGLPRQNFPKRGDPDIGELSSVRYIDASSIVKNRARKWKILCKLPKQMHVAAFAML